MLRSGDNNCLCCYLLTKQDNVSDVMLETVDLNVSDLMLETIDLNVSNVMFETVDLNVSDLMLEAVDLLEVRLIQFSHPARRGSVTFPRLRL